MTDFFSILFHEMISMWVKAKIIENCWLGESEIVMKNIDTPQKWGIVDRYGDGSVTYDTTSSKTVPSAY